MVDDFSQTTLERVVAQICQTIGFERTRMSALEALTDVLMNHLRTICIGAHRYSELSGRTEPSLRDFIMIFRDLGIEMSELSDYIVNVGEIPVPFEVPKYPVNRENHLNFLRPGNNEVILRPLHIHDYLPPQFPDSENKPVVQETDKAKSLVKLVDTTSLKRTRYKSSNKETGSVVYRKPRLTVGGQPLREIKSVLMTRSGFLSSSREGKLPDVKTPVVTRTKKRKKYIETAISSSTLLAANGLTRNRNKNVSNLSEQKFKTKKIDKNHKTNSPSVKTGKQINKDNVLRKMVQENFKKLKSGSRLIDKHLDNLIRLNPKLKHSSSTSAAGIVPKVSVPSNSISNKKIKNISERTFSKTH